MSDTNPRLSDERLLQRVLSRWDNEGGAIPSDPQDGHVFVGGRSKVPQLTNAELAGSP
jgi:hypothetical protein